MALQNKSNSPTPGMEGNYVIVPSTYHFIIQLTFFLLHFNLSPQLAQLPNTKSVDVGTRWKLFNKMFFIEKCCFVQTKMFSKKHIDFEKKLIGWFLRLEWTICRERDCKRENLSI